MFAVLTQWLCELQSTLSLPLLSALQSRLEALHAHKSELEARRERLLHLIAAEEACDQLCSEVQGREAASRGSESPELLQMDASSSFEERSS